MPIIALEYALLLLVNLYLHLKKLSIFKLSRIRLDIINNKTTKFGVAIAFRMFKTTLPSFGGVKNVLFFVSLLSLLQYINKMPTKSCNNTKSSVLILD